MFKNYSKYVIPLTILFFASILYNRYKDKQHRQENLDDYEIIQKYLLTEHSLDNYEEDERNGNKKRQKPILWIHMNYEYNSRSWASFGSRSSTELNQPYLYLTVRSIIHHCKESFHICLIDDDSFSKLLPNWNVDVNTISNPILTYVRYLGIAKILYKYGGFFVPPSFLCMQNLINTYNVGTREKKMFVGEFVNTSVTADSYPFSPNMKFMGALKETQSVKDYINYIQETISNDYTSQNEFTNHFNSWIKKCVDNKTVKLIDGKFIGTKTLDEEPILLDHLFSNDYLNVYPKITGIYIPADEILKRRKYEWFSRLSPRDVLTSNTIIGKYMLLSNSLEGNENIVGPKDDLSGHVAYWQVPTGSDSGIGLWGLKPNYLGNRLRHSNVQKDFVK